MRCRFSLFPKSSGSGYELWCHDTEEARDFPSIVTAVLHAETANHYQEGIVRLHDLDGRIVERIPLQWLAD